MKLIGACLLFMLALLCDAAAQAETYELEWVRQIGTSGDDESLSVAVDAAGNSYIAGSTTGNLEGVNLGSSDAFLMKFDGRGNELWTHQFGGPSLDWSQSVAVDSAGNAYITGHISGGLDSEGVDADHGFVKKFDTDGSELWNRRIGAGVGAIGTSLAIDAHGNAYLSGSTWGSLAQPNAGWTDAFLMKLDSRGDVLWTEQIGTGGFDYGQGVAIDDAGNSYLGGATHVIRTDNDAGGSYLFVRKFDSSGDELWVHEIGYISTDYYGGSVAVDAVGRAYVTGYGDAGYSVFGGVSGAFLAKVEGNGSVLWTEEVGASCCDESYSVAVDTKGNAYISGQTTVRYLFTDAAFWTKVDSSGNELWTEQIGASSWDRSNSVTVDAAGNVYISGVTYGSLGGPNAGGADAFLAKYRVVPEPGAAVLAALGGVLLLRHEQRRRA